MLNHSLNGFTFQIEPTFLDNQLMIYLFNVANYTLALKSHRKYYATNEQSKYQITAKSKAESH